MITDKLFYSKSGFRIGRILLILLILAMLLLLFFWNQQNKLQVNQVSVTAQDLPRAFEGLRIVQLSDLHGKEFGLEHETILRKVKALEPDLIAITGDMIDQEGQKELMLLLAEKLAGIAPTYYVTGNHEWAVGAVREWKAALTERGVTVLSNEFELWERDGASIAIAGIDDPNGPADQKTGDELRGEIDADYTILLSHRNTPYDYAGWGYDLVLCGHGHGGVVRIPILDKGVLSTDRTFFPEFDGGLYQFADGGWCFESRGLGSNTVPYQAFRLFNRPELPLLILSSEG